MDFHTPSGVPGVLERFDARAIASQLKRAGVEVVNFFAKCHYGNSYYFTQVGHRHPSLKSDVLAEVVDACKSQDIAVSAYYSLCIDDHACQENPDWEVVDADGKPASGRFGHACLSSPYAQELALPQVRELLEGYAVDGLWFDFARPWHCYCRYCQRAFEKQFGRPLPKDSSDPVWLDYVQWRRQIGAEFERTVRRLIDQLRPRLHFCGNWSYSSREPLAPPSDSITYLTSDPPTNEAFQLNASFETRCLARANMPVEIITPRFHEGWGDWTLKPAELLKAEVASAMACGGLPCIGDQMYPSGELEPAVYEVIREAFHFAEQREAFCADTESVASIAVLHSASTFFRRAHPDSRDGDALAAVRGAHKAVIESGFHCDILNEEQLQRHLSDYQALIIPEQDAMSAEVAERISSFVRDGGMALATSLCGICDEKGKPLPDFRLAGVFGVRFSGISPYSCCYIVIDDPNLKARAPAMPILVKGSSAIVAPVAARPWARIAHPILEASATRSFSHRQAPPAQPSANPAITYEEYGQGKAVYAAAEIFRAYWETNDSALRRLVGVLLDLSLDRRAAWLEGGWPSVEMSVRRRGEELFVHLVQSHEDKRVLGAPSLGKMPFLRSLTVHVQAEKAISSVTSLPDGTELPFVQKPCPTGENCVTFTVPELHIWGIYRLA
jgi:hypothetical protein